MRTDKELLQILLDEFPRLLRREERLGLCGAIDGLFIYNEITFEERKRLLAIIRNNKPNNARFYYWPCGEIEPRKQFLTELIKKYS